MGVKFQGWSHRIVRTFSNFLGVNFQGWRHRIIRIFSKFPEIFALVLANTGPISGRVLVLNMWARSKVLSFHTALLFHVQGYFYESLYFLEKCCANPPKSPIRELLELEPEKAKFA